MKLFTIFALYINNDILMVSQKTRRNEYFIKLINFMSVGR